MVAPDVEDQYRKVVATTDGAFQRIEVTPTLTQSIGRFTIVCLILNRTIGSGIFIIPSKVLLATGSVGASLMLWFAGGIISFCGLLVWLTLGLSVPLSEVPGEEDEKSVPRSGGEKNYLEFIFGKPQFLTTCMYGIVFILLGNLSGNAIAFGEYCFRAAGKDNPSEYRGAIIGIAIAVLSACALLHIISRSGGIWLNNFFAMFKVALLLTIIILGFIKASGKSLGGAPPATSNFQTAASFRGSHNDVASFSDSLLNILFAYSGFEQPFYVLGEVASPRRVFPSSTLTAMGITTFLFVLTNVAFFCAVPKDLQLDNQTVDLASLFLEHVFGNTGAQKAMAALIAISIFGNILVMTFTAARVKQEIAKEGIIPGALTFATSHTTPWGWLRSKLANGSSSGHGLNDHLEQSPMAALGLHWFSSILLIVVTSMLDPRDAYTVLVWLYSYVLTVGLGFVVSGGLLYLTLNPKRHWSRYCNFHVPLQPLHAVIYFVACGFLLYATFVKPLPGSPFSSSSSGVPWYIVPAIGQSTWLWGLVWFFALHLILLYRGKTLVVTRVPLIVKDEGMRGQWIQKLEVVTHELHLRGNNTSLRPLISFNTRSQVA